MRRHLPLDELGGLPLVETGRALLRDARQRARQVRLAKPIPHLIRVAVVRELRDRRRVVTHPRQHTGERPGKRVGHDEPVSRQRDGRLDQPRPWQRPVLGPGQVQPGHRARYPDRQVAVVVEGAVVLAALHEHRRGRPARRRFPEVVRHRVTLGRSKHQKPTATDIAGGGVGDCQRERRRDRRIDRVPPVPHDLVADPRRDGVLRHHHRSTRPDRLRAADKQDRREHHEQGGNDRHATADRSPSDPHWHALMIATQRHAGKAPAVDTQDDRAELRRALSTAKDP